MCCPARTVQPQNGVSGVADRARRIAGVSFVSCANGQLRQRPARGRRNPYAFLDVRRPGVRLLVTPAVPQKVYRDAMRLGYLPEHRVWPRRRITNFHVVVPVFGLPHGASSDRGEGASRPRHPQLHGRWQYRSVDLMAGPRDRAASAIRRGSYRSESWTHDHHMGAFLGLRDSPPTTDAMYPAVRPNEIGPFPKRPPTFFLQYSSRVWTELSLAGVTSRPSRAELSASGSSRPVAAGFVPSSRVAGLRRRGVQLAVPSARHQCRTAALTAPVVTNVVPRRRPGQFSTSPPGPTANYITGTTGQAPPLAPRVTGILAQRAHTPRLVKQVLPAHMITLQALI